MDVEEQQKLIQELLYHPVSIITILRLTRALLFVIDATGPRGERAFEIYCNAWQPTIESKIDH